jgi:outer membrane receptor protein involved in Fe transport
LLSLNGGYSYASTVRWNNSSFNNSGGTIAYAVNSANPAAGICYGPPAVAGAGPTAGACNSTAWRYTLGTYGSFGVTPSTGSPSVGAIGSLSCGGAPCEYLVVNNGISGTYNTVAPAFSNASFEDRFRPTDKLLLDFGVHYDDFRFNLVNAEYPAGPEPNSATLLQRQFWNNVFINSNCQDTSTLLLVAKPTGGACPAGSVPVTFSLTNPSTNDYHAFEPHVGFTYTVDPLTVLRASYSKTAQAPSSAFQQYNSASGPFPLQAQFYPIGFRSSAHSIGPEYSYNVDFSFEHQLKGSDVGFSISPFVRTTSDQIYNVLLDPKTGFISGDNVADEIADGVELALHKGDFARDGFAAQLSYTFTAAKVHYQTLQNGQTVMGPVNAGIEYYNSFTKACATNPTDPRCSTDVNHPAPAPCYTTAGAPDPTCAATSVANPYWNSPIQSLESDSAFYPAMNQTFVGAGGSSNTGVTSSYVIPHVAALLLQYKHGPLTIAPTFQLSAGEKYGSPLANYGIDPSSCTSNLAGLVTGASDPRYTYGLPAGTTAANGYLAQSCAGTVLTPNRYTGAFDTFGAYTEPTNITANFDVKYDFTKRVSIRAQVVNLLDQCFGGSKVPWANAGPRLGCNYVAGGQAAYAGNFYNPGNAFQSGGNQYPYSPVIAQVDQSVYGTAVNPLQVYVTLELHL